MLVVVPKVQQRDVDRAGDAIGRSRVRRLLNFHRHLSEDGHLDNARQHIGTKQGRAARRAGGTEVETHVRERGVGAESRRGLFGSGDVEDEVHALAFAKHDGVLLNHTGFVFHQRQPALLLEIRGEVERSVTVAGVLEAEVNVAGRSGKHAGGDQRHGGGQRHAELFRHGEVHLQTGLFAQLCAAGIGEPHVPTLLLDIGPGGNGEVDVDFCGGAASEWRQDHVRAVAAAAGGVHTDDGERCHPRCVGHVGLQANGGRRVPVVGQGAAEDGELSRSHGVTVFGIVTVHVERVIGNTADTKVDEIVDVEAFAGDAAVRIEQDAEGVRAAAHEHVGVGQIGNLQPGFLRVPREVGPLPWGSTWHAFGNVPADGFIGIIEVARTAPEFHVNSVPSGHAAPCLEVELAGHKFVGVEQVSANVRTVDVLGQSRIGCIGFAGLAGLVAAVDQAGGFRVGRVVASGSRVAPVNVTRGAGGAVGFPRTCRGCIATGSRVLSGEKLLGGGGGCRLHRVGCHGHGNVEFTYIVGVGRVVAEHHGGTDDQPALEVVGGGVEDGVGCGGCPLEFVVEGLTTREQRSFEVERLHHVPDGVDDLHGHWRCFTNSGLAVALNLHVDLNAAVDKDVIQLGAVGLNPLAGVPGGHVQLEGSDGVVVVGTPATGGGLCWHDHVHGHGLKQQQQNDGEGHHTAHGHQRSCERD